jgi:hypothetical protein
MPFAAFSALSPRSIRSKSSLFVLAMAVLLLPATARAQTITAGGTIKFTASDSTAQSSTVTVSGAPGPVSTVQVTLHGVHSNGTGNYLSMAYAEFMLQSPTGEQFVLLGQTGDGTDNGGLIGQDIIIVNYWIPAPNSTTSDTPWPTASPQMVEPGSYYYANGDGPPPLPTAENASDYPQTDGSQTLNGKFSGVMANGTWTLYLIDNDPDVIDPVSITGWTLALTYGSATPTTTVLSSGSNPAFYINSASGASITYTATVTSGSGTPTGVVTFQANGTTISGCNAVALSGGVAHCSASLAQGNYGIAAQYAPTGVYGQSSGSLEQLVEVTAANPSGDQWCNNRLLSVPANDNPGLAYPSIIGISDSSYNGKTVGNVTVVLEGLQGTDGINGQFLLVGPGGGAYNLVFLQDGFAVSGATSAVNLTFDDIASASVPYNSGNPTSGAYLPTDNNEAPNPDTFPTSTSPSVDSSVPQVPGTLNFAPPFGSDTVTYAHTNVLTFGEAFNGASANGKWALYTVGPYAANLNSGWCITLSLNSGIATTTTLTPSSNPATTGQPLTFTATVTSGGNPVTTGGTVTFLDNGVAPAGTVSGNNAVALNGSGVAKFTTSSLTEGDHAITANYSGTASDNESFSAVLHQRINTATTAASVNSSTWSYCNPGAVQIQGGALAGPLTPNPSVITVANLPGTLNNVSVTLNGFSVLTTYGLEELASLVESPTGAALDFFSNTTQGANGNGEASFGAYTFADSGPGLVSAGNTSISPGAYKPTAYLDFLSNPDVFTSSLSGFYNVPSFSYAASHGSSTFANIFTNGSNANGTWSLFFSSGNANATFGAANGWCVNLTENLPTVTPVVSHSGNYAQGQQNAVFTVSVTNHGAGSTGDPAGGHPLTVSDTLPAGLSYAIGFGSGWSCSGSGASLTCTNDSTIGYGLSYPPLYIDVNVSATAPSSVSNSVSVSGGGANPASSNTDTITINPAPVLSVTKTHTGTFTQGSTAAEWDITVSNVATGGATSGTVNVSDALPSGYSVNNFGSTSSAAWSCSGTSTVSCSTTSGLSEPGGSSFPTIQVIVNVPVNSPTSVINTALAWGGGDLTHISLGTAATSNTDSVTVVQVPASITVNGGGTQSTTISTAFGIGLAVTVKDASGVPIQNSSVIFTAPGSGASGSFSNSSNTITVKTDSSGVANAGTFTANSTAGGPYSVSVTDSPATAVSFNLTNSPATETVTLGSLAQTYTGSPLAATATTSPVSGLTVTFTYTGISPTTYATSPNPPAAAGSYTVVGTVSNPNYQGSATGTLVIRPATETVSLGSLAQAYTGSPLAATATTSPVSGLTVTFTYTGISPTTYATSPTPPAAAGSYTVVGTISNPNYQGSATGTLVIRPATETVSLGSLAQTYTGSSLAATATTSPVSGLTVTFTYTGISPTTYPTSSTPPAGAGSYTVVGTVSNPNYQGSATGTLVISVSSGGTVILITTATLTGSASTGYTATVTVANTGTGTASNVLLKTATLGSATGSPLPQTLGSIASGRADTVTVQFPGSAGSDGARVAENYAGTSTGGTFSAVIRAVLP